MNVNIEAEGMKEGVLGLVLALVEVIKDALKIQAYKRVESGDLSEEEVERLGRAIIELDEAVDRIKCEQGIEETVAAVRNGLDDLVNDVLERLINPERWAEEARD